MLKKYIYQGVYYTVVDNDREFSGDTIPIDKVTQELIELDANIIMSKLKEMHNIDRKQVAVNLEDINCECLMVNVLKDKDGNLQYLGECTINSIQDGRIKFNKKYKFSVIKRIIYTRKFKIDIQYTVSNKLASPKQIDWGNNIKMQINRII